MLAVGFQFMVHCGVSVYGPLWVFSLWSIVGFQFMVTMGFQFMVTVGFSVYAHHGFSVYAHCGFSVYVHCGFLHDITVPVDWA